MNSSKKRSFFGIATRLIVMIIFLGILPGCNLVKPTCAICQITAIEGSEMYEKIAATNFARWNNALLSGDAKQVAALYVEDATFLPTLSPKFMTGGNAVQYFEHFLLKKPDGKIKFGVVQVIPPNAYLHSGLYNFEVGEVGDRHTVEARFTFLWIKSGGEWKIAHHHSSLLPTELTK